MLILFKHGRSRFSGSDFNTKLFKKLSDAAGASTKLKGSTRQGSEKFFKGGFFAKISVKTLIGGAAKLVIILSDGGVLVKIVMRRIKAA